MTAVRIVALVLAAWVTAGALLCLAWAGLRAWEKRAGRP